MPKVSEAHRAARRDQIVVAAMRTIARDGFAGMTMADVIAESGLSAGAVYTYFASKAQLIDAIGEIQLSGALEIFDRALETGDPDPAAIVEELAEMIAGADERDGGDRSVVIVQVMAHTMLSPDETLPMRRRIQGLRDSWLAVVRRMQDTGRIDADADPEAVARVLLSLLPGFVLQRRIIGPVDPAAYASGLRALMTAG